MAIPGGWTLLETTLEGVLATSHKRQSVATLTTVAPQLQPEASSQTAMWMRAREVSVSALFVLVKPRQPPRCPHIQRRAPQPWAGRPRVLTGWKPQQASWEGSCLCAKQRAHMCVRVCVRGLGSGESERRSQAAHGRFFKGGSIGSYFIWLHVLQGRLLTFIYFKTIAWKERTEELRVRRIKHPQGTAGVQVG